jgi:hypothetical protein
MFILVVPMNYLYFLRRLAPLTMRVEELHWMDHHRVQASTLIGLKLVLLLRMLEAKTI